MDIISLIIASVLVILLFIWLIPETKLKNPLPGPIGLPFVGYLPFLTKKPYITFTKLAKKYGPVYKIRLGSRDVVILCDIKIIKRAFADEVFMTMPSDLSFEMSDTTIRTGAILDLPWKEQRQFSLHALKDLGFGKTQMEEHMKEEIFEVLDRLEQEKYAFNKMADILTASTSNNIASLLFGKRMKYNDPNRQRLVKLIRDYNLLGKFIVWQIFFPYIRSFMRFFNLGNQGKLSRNLFKVKHYCREEIVEREKTYDSNNIQSFVDAYLLEIEKKGGDSNTTFQRDVLVDLATIFFGAGTRTVTDTLHWILLMAADSLEIQKKVHQEIDEILGRDRFPTWQDHLRMPYTEAVILEVMRWKTIVPLSNWKHTLKDTKLSGFFIPKNSYVIANYYASDHDESLWGKDAHEYRPDRFLSEDGKKVVKPEYFFPFSIGKRSCLGKSYSEIEVFLYFVAILQKFKLSMSPGKRANFEGVLGVTSQPEKQDIHLELR